MNGDRYESKYVQSPSGIYNFVMTYLFIVTRGRWQINEEELKKKLCVIWFSLWTLE